MLAPAPSPAALTLPLRTPRSASRSPVVPPEVDTQPRFTPDGSRELEQHLAQTCAKIAAGIRGLIPARKLEAVLLGGGYGRGEGGVLRIPAGDKPYNDLEFYVCLRGNRHLNELRFGRALHVLGEILTPQAGIEVEFKITSLRELERASVSMFSYDLLAGHRWLVGDEPLLARCSHHRDPEAIPMSEATRLLMNRCSGLLFAQEKLGRPVFTEADADFVRRNLAKAELALGDAVLVAHRQYHWSARERHRRIERLARADTSPWLQEVARHHAAGVAFKLHPERSTAPRDVLRAAHAPLAALARQVFLWVESRRLGRAFTSVADYAASSIDKCPELRGPRTFLVNARARGPRALLAANPFCHPRQRVLHALALLLWEPMALADPATVARLQRELHTPATTFADLMRAYRELWARVN
jgi:hypothetical protein